MEVTVGARMGGPELGASVLPLMALLRRRLKREWAGIVHRDIESISYLLFFSGSLTDYFPTAGVRSARYAKSKKAVTVEVGVSALETKDISQTGLAKLLHGRFLESLEAIAKEAEKHGIMFDIAAARGAFSKAYLALESAS